MLVHGLLCNIHVNDDRFILSPDSVLESTGI
jgi:hypothetical protein